MTSKYDGANVTADDAVVLGVLKVQSDKLGGLPKRLDVVDKVTDDAIVASEALLQRLHKHLPEQPLASARHQPHVIPIVQPWSEIVAEAETLRTGSVGIGDLLTPDEIASVDLHLAFLREDFDSLHRLDAIDWTIAGVAGTLAALVDTFLIKMPSSTGMLGGAPKKGGALSDYIREKLRNSMSADDVRELERCFPVPYDAAHSGGLTFPVSGLGPRTHRFQSFGHDPVLGFLFGTLDILSGSMTAIDSAGKLILQKTNDVAPGLSLFEALGRQLGHLKSDVGTRAGLPAPLMPLLQFLQVGSMGEKGRTIGEVVRLMYVQGYDFGHFLAMSVCPLIIESLVRLSYAAKRLTEGHDILDCVPFGLPGKPSPPKLNTMLFTAHLIATGVNAGRVCLSQNPLAVNYPEWIAFAKYSIVQLNWALVGKEAARLAHVQKTIDHRWSELNSTMEICWKTATTVESSG